VHHRRRRDRRLSAGIVPDDRLGDRTVADDHADPHDCVRTDDVDADPRPGTTAHDRLRVADARSRSGAQ
jgi:hypothetical protein